jgi:hypothetical protein
MFMAITSFTIARPVRLRTLVAPRDFELRDRAIAKFEAGDFLDAVLDTLKYVLPDTDVASLPTQALQISQGSARVHIELLDQQLRVYANLASFSDQSQTVAALRFFLSRLSGTGQMAQPRLHAQTVRLEYAEDISLLHPHKLIEVMYRLPVEADNHDAWLQEQFDLEMTDRHAPVALDDAQFAQAWRIWDTHWQQVDALMMESRRRRQLSVLDSLGSIALNHLVFSLPLFGPVRARLIECSDQFTSRDENASKRDAELAKCIKEMRLITPEKLRDCLAHAPYALNPQQEGTQALLSSILGGGSRMQKTSEHRAAGRGLEATLELLADFLYLLAHHSWPDDVDAALRAALETATDKPFREAADLLYQSANQISKTFGNHSESENGNDPDSEAESDDEAIMDDYEREETHSSQAARSALDKHSSQAARGALDSNTASRLMGEKP